MSMAEKFIEENTRNCINTMQCYDEDCNPQVIFKPWLTPDQARRAVEIAREEIYQWLASHYRDYMHNPTGKQLEAFFGMDMINDLKQVMEDE